MPGRECYHCKQWVEKNEEHDCWTTTEENLTRDLPDELRDAWERLRETAADFGEQRIYASHKSIMFSRKACYFFVRPKKKVLEVYFFLGRTVLAPQVRRAEKTSKVKVGHLVHITHRDEVEEPITDWLREAYETSDTLRVSPRKEKAAPRASRKKKKKKKTMKKPVKKAAKKKRKTKRA